MTRGVRAEERARWRRFAREVIVERRRFSRSSWQPWFDRLRKVIAEHRGVLERIGGEAPEVIDPRELLVRAWCVLMAAPENTAQHYAAIRERNEAGTGLEDEAAHLRANGYTLRGLASSPEMQMRWLGGLVRAIDADLAGIDYWPRRAERWTPEAWRPEGYPCYVVPVRRQYRCEDGKERGRRATYLHAIVPDQLGELQTELMLHPDVAVTDETHDWTHGAAVFDGLTIDVERVGEDRYRVTDAPHTGDDMEVGEQVQSALALNCDTLIWPELTVPQARLALIKAALATDPLRDPRRIALTIAGSWHVAHGDAMANRATILHGRGQTLGHYDKRREYPFGDLHEHIVPGTELPVVVMEDRLVSVAICRDFCDDNADKVYDELGIDLLLVPSMGARSTHDAHDRSAKRLQSQQGAISVIVQQVPVQTGTERSTDEPPGYSFTAPARTGAPGDQPIDPRQSVPFRPLRGRR